MSKINIKILLLLLTLFVNGCCVFSFAEKIDVKYGKTKSITKYPDGHIIER